MSHSTIILPKIGLGTYSLRGAEGVAVMRDALEAGYRLLDSAFNYDNEGAVGQAVRESGIDRDEILITSKLPGRHHDRREAIRSIEESRYRLGVERIDLYLIHWPNPRQRAFLGAWEALIDAREKGLVAHIGVSNFLPEHIEELHARTGVMPEVNQLEIHPAFPQSEILAWHAERGIQVEAWSPLGRGEMLRDETVVAAAAAAGMTPGELILAWHAARGTVPLPRSTSPERLRENLRGVDKPVPAAAVAALEERGSVQGRLWGQDPATYEEF